MALRIDSSQNRNLYVGTAEVAVSDGNAIITGRVGIGTTNPTEKLVVQDGKVLAGHTNTKGYGFHDLSNYSYTANTSRLSLVTAGVEAVSIDSVQNVGIKTTSPTTYADAEADDLVIGDATATANGITIASATSGSGSFMFSDGTSGVNRYRGALIYDHGDRFGNGADTMMFRTLSTTKMTILSGGNVGIGTTSPGNILHVSSAGSDTYVRVGNNAGYDAGIYFNTSTDWTIGTDTSNSNAFTIGNGSSVGASPKIVIQTGGNVGIGTASPTGYRLVVENTSEDLLKLHNSTDGLDALISFTNPGGTLGRIQGIDNGGLGFDVGNNAGGIISNAMFVKNNGNVGISTTTPQRVLDVNVGGNSGVGASFAGTISAGEYQGIHFGYSEAGNANYRKSALVFERDDAGLGDATGKIHILNNAQNGSNSATLADSRLTILKGGNVGIGTTNPSAKFVIADGMSGTNSQTGFEFIPQDSNNRNIIFSYDRSSGAYRELNFDASNFRFNPGGSTKVVIDTSGDVGIGTTGPQELLDVNTNLTGLNVDNTAAIFGNDIGTTQSRDTWIKMRASAAASDRSWAFGTNQGGDFRFNYLADRTITPTNAAASTLLTIKNTGKVGIGTTSPDKDLTVGGINPTHGINLRTKSGSSEWLIWSVEQFFSQEGYMRLFYDNVSKIQFRAGGDSFIAGGKLGIGLTTTPLNTLHVAGSVRATSGVYFNSTSTIGFKIENDSSNNELDIYGGALTAAITINNAGLLKFGNYGIGGSGTAKYVLGLDGSSNVVKATSFNTLVDDQLPTTDAAASGTIVNWSVSESTTAGLLYVVKTNGGWTTADADFEARSTYMLAIALSTDADEGMLLQGFFYKSSHGFTIGAPLYISNTAGAFSNSRPTGTNDYVRIIGYATSANYIYFDPDKTWIKLT